MCYVYLIIIFRYIMKLTKEETKLEETEDIKAGVKIESKNISETKPDVKVPSS